MYCHAGMPHDGGRREGALAKTVPAYFMMDDNSGTKILGRDVDSHDRFFKHYS